MQASITELDGRFAALTTQRDTAMNQIVMLAGQLSALAEENAALKALVAELTPKESSLSDDKGD